MRRPRSHGEALQAFAESLQGHQNKYVSTETSAATCKRCA